MVQDQLVDYITTQTKLGTSRDAIKATLQGVGWQAADIDDSFKKVDGVAAASATVSASVMPTASSPAKFSPSQSFPATNPATSPAAMGSAKPMSSGPGPQVIRMSDLVSSSDSSSSSMTNAAKLPAALATKGAKITATSFEASPASSGMGGSSKKPMIIYAVLGVLALLCAGAAGYLYMQNNSLSAKIGSATGTSTGITAQVTTLTAQVNALQASSTALASNMTALTAANEELMTELSFYAVPLGTTPTTTPLTVTGSLGVNAAKNYFVIGSYGGRIFVANSKDAKVIAVLQPLVGSSTQLMGTTVPGSDMMTVTSVNGAAL